MKRADLHVHTYYSDGALSPEEAVRLAKENGVDILAVTDHDNMNGSKEVKDLCKQAGICAVDGIEISAYDCVKVHVLGYNVNSECAAFREYYERCLTGALARMEDILSKLKRRGINLTLSDVDRERVCKHSPYHSTYVARAACRKGYGESVQKFYLEYLNMGKCAYSGLFRPTPEEAVAVIRACGGFASLAHPGRIALDEAPKLSLISRLCDCGLKGIEACYSGHTDRETAYYKEIAQRFSLLVTGGSDTHYPEGNRKIGTPEFYPDEKLLSALNIN